MVKKHKLLMDKADDANSASGYGSGDSKTSSTDKANETSGNNTDKAADDKTKAQGDSSQAAATDKSQQAKTSTESKTENVSGYSTDDKKSSSEGDDSSKDAKAAADAATEDKPLELDLKDLKEEQVQDLRDFAKTHKLSKEQAQALVEKRKEVLEANAKAQADQVVETQNIYKRWEKELQDDPEFGGANFANNVHNVNKFMQDHLPGTTKLLTESGRRVSPIQMKEFAKIASKLYGEGEHHEGSGSKKSEERNPWDVYKN